jgi:hypothetical protein
MRGGNHPKSIFQTQNQLPDIQLKRMKAKDGLIPVLAFVLPGLGLVQVSKAQKQPFIFG